MRAGKVTDSDIVITEIGGTVGDIESLPFLEAIRQMKSQAGSENVFYIHTTLVPYLKAAGEMKTKPTQHSVKELRGLGIQPNMLVVRTEEDITDGMRSKIAAFCDVEPEAVIESQDVASLYEIPLNLKAQKMDDIVMDHFSLQAPQADMSKWEDLVDHVNNRLNHTINIALVGKYVALQDAYISVNEALKHAGYVVDADIKITKIDSEKLTKENVAEQLAGQDGIIVPGGFGDRGIEGMIHSIQYARENDVPFLGICLGMQMASVEFARNVLGYQDANSAEMDPATKHNIIDLMADQEGVKDMGGTQRLGLYPCKLKEGSVAAAAYDNQEMIEERHRHRFEFNNDYRAEMEAKGLVFSGTSPDNRLVEVIELPEKKFFVAAQYHPEFLSRPQRPEGLFKAFIAAANK
ncbi:CTP synthase (glutamine hydrolyzing) [Pediococcus pentosaceus]|uniref:CTP synthase (glutamine hydrolyzing) n=1 Tax=Pediococcus pentosaceus TaxID=1255 RepID=A0A1Y0VLJ3_PEDPE|nr:CTP synthase (glutamine hydrolyzing) [Pediococcus pentosaceus]